MTKRETERLDKRVARKVKKKIKRLDSANKAKATERLKKLRRQLARLEQLNQQTLEGKMPRRTKMLNLDELRRLIRVCEEHGW